MTKKLPPRPKIMPAGVTLIPRADETSLTKLSNGKSLKALNYMKVFRLDPTFGRLGKFCVLGRRHISALADEMRFSPKTVNQRRSHLDRFYGFLQNVLKLDIEPQHVTKDMIVGYLSWLSNVEGLARNSVSSHATGLRTFYRWLNEENILRFNPIEALKPPKRFRNLPRPMPFRDIAALINTFNPKDWRELRDLALVEILYGSGLRLTEGLSLRPMDINLDDRKQPHVRVLGKGSKYRVVPLTTESVIVLRKHLAARGPINEKDYLFIGTGSSGMYLPLGMFEMRFKRYLLRAGLDKSISPHCLRHSFATHMLANGADIYTISKLMGHEQISTTMIYLAVSQIQVFEAFRIASPRDHFKVPYEDRCLAQIASINRH